jgi:hypothetical protein
MPQNNLPAPSLAITSKVEVGEVVEVVEVEEGEEQVEVVVVESVM